MHGRAAASEKKMAAGFMTGSNKTDLSRRAFGLGLGATVAGTALMGRNAQALAGNEGDIIINRFNGPRVDTRATATAQALNNSPPVLSMKTVEATRRSLEQHLEIQARGGWNPIEPQFQLRLGSSGRIVRELRARLIASGDLNPREARSRRFDDGLLAAVRRFQMRNGLIPDGLVRRETLYHLNVPVATRIMQLRTNLVRLTALSGDLGPRFVMVNIPGAEIEAVESGVVAGRHSAVVGKVDRQTPIVTSAIHEVNFNPFWHAPKSIVRRDIIPKMQEDPDYLRRYSIRIYDGGGREIDPRAVDWYSDEAVRYLLRQDPGEENALGHIRINFHNKHSVYLHDTPQKALFDENARFHSSGCVRVENVREFVTWLLTPNGDWTRQRIDSTIASGERIDADLSLRTPIYMVYVTAWASGDGLTQFRPDVYAWDAAGRMAIAGQDI
jgi:murein L,D-transpeptidase YcbB/YkuD